LLYDIFDAPFEPLYRRGRVLIGGASRGITLELGAGTGKNLRYYRSSAQVIASDVSEAMLARARRRLRRPIRGLLVADVAHLPVRDKAIDTVVATFVCCVQPDPRPALAEIERVLRRGGQALLMEFVVPRGGWLRTLMRVIEPSLGAVYGVHWEYDLPGLLSAAGLEINEVKGVWPPLVHAIFAAKR
jgi:ubiquinone/menaquinone biosynthesis C-methylase UbiE